MPFLGAQVEYLGVPCLEVGGVEESLECLPGGGWNSPILGMESAMEVMGDGSDAMPMGVLWTS